MKGESGGRGHCREMILSPEEATQAAEETRNCALCLGNHRVRGDGYRWAGGRLARREAIVCQVKEALSGQNPPCAQEDNRRSFAASTRPMRAGS